MDAEKAAKDCPDDEEATRFTCGKKSMESIFAMALDEITEDPDVDVASLVLPP